MGETDWIRRDATIEALNKLIDRFELILRDIRESNEDESVCGLCEYDGAYIGQSGDWCNECPGFDKDDCFKLSDECRKRWLKSVDLPSAQPKKVCVAEIKVDIDDLKDYIDKAINAERWIPCSDCERRCDKWEHSKTSRE